MPTTNDAGPATRERPVIFSSDMVRAILDGRKTMTRRTAGLADLNAYPGRLSGDGVMGQPLGYMGLCKSDLYVRNKRGYAESPGSYHWFYGEREEPREINPIPLRCPFGAVGDALWVREEWCARGLMYGKPVVDVAKYAGRDALCYRADGDTAREGWAWRRAIHMPRWASRLTLRVTGVRVERVGRITEADVFAEGVRRCVYRHGSRPHIQFCDDGPDGYVEDPVMPEGGRVHPPVAAFRETWNRIHGPGAFDLDPWVWCVEFRRES